MADQLLTFIPVDGANYKYDFVRITAELSELAATDRLKFLQFARFWCQESLFFLLYFVLRVPVNHPWLVDRINEVEERNDRTLDLWARESYKSTIITYGLNIQSILNDPNIRIGIFSHTRSIAKAFLRRIKATLESNDFLKSLFPDILYENPTTQSTKWSEDDGLTVKRPSVFQECTVEAYGIVDGQPTSRHYSVLNYDDLVTRDSVSTPDQIRKVEECFRLSLNLGTADGKRRIIGTTYHFADLYEMLKKQGGWKVRIYPAEDEEGNPVLRTKDQLIELRKQLGPYVYNCLPENTVIIKSDFSLEAIQDIKVGDHVLGVAKGNHNKKGGFCPAVVLARSEQVSEVIRYELENGDYIDCTKEHKWWTGRWESPNYPRKEYLPIIREHGGSYGHVIKVFDLPWGELTKHEWECAMWLGGIFDGEGSCSSKGTLNISQSEKENPAVCARIEYSLKTLGFDFGKQGRNDDKSGVFIYYLRGGRSEHLRFLLLTNPARRKEIVDHLLYRSSRIGGKNAVDGITKVIGFSTLGGQKVYNIQTTTGNYIANGYVSSNCQQLLNPVAKEDQRFRAEWLKFYKKPPASLTLFLLCDPANTKKYKQSGGDFTVFWLWGIDSLGNKFLVDAVRDRLLLTERWTKLRNMVRKYNNIQKIGYEEYGMTADIQYFQERMADEAFYFTIIPLGGTKLSKEDRILRMVPQFENGKVFLPEELLYKNKDGDTVDLVKIFIQEEYLSFPFSVHDDLLDAASRIEDESFNYWRPYDGPVDLSDDPRPLQNVITTGWAETKSESRFAGL